MINREHRFHGHGSLQYVFKRGSAVRGKALSLRFTPNARRQTYRAAVIVSRKVSKSAVVRNRIRRRIYERVRILSTNFTGAYDITFFVFDERLATLPAPQLNAEITTLLMKAHILHGRSASGHAIVDDTKD